MDPVALHLGPLTIRWYGVFVAVGFLAGYQCIQWRARRYEVEREEAADLALLGMVAGVLGARVLYVVQNWDREFREHWAEIPRIDHGGLVFFGGFFAGVLALVIYTRRHRLRLGAVADLFAPALALGHAGGRIGCFLNGCCFGRPWNGLGAVAYSPGSDVARVQALQGLITSEYSSCLPVLPTQVLEALANLVICAGLLSLERRAGRTLRPGRLAAVYLVLAAGTRFATEFGRGDYLHHIGPFTPAQVICLALLPAGVVLVRLTRSTPAARQPAGDSAGTHR